MEELELNDLDEDSLKAGTSALPDLPEVPTTDLVGPTKGKKKGKYILFFD